MLKEKWLNFDTQKLLSHHAYTPFPPKSDRSNWEAVEPSFKQHIIKEATSFLDKDWPVLPAIRYMDFVRNGDRSRFQDYYHERRHRITYLLLAECLENKGCFLEELINGIWCLCEETTWCIPAHMNHIHQGIRDPLPDFISEYPYVDLFSAETGSLLAWIYYFLNKDLENYSPSLNLRIIAELKRRITLPYMHHNDFWWMGFSGVKPNNWNPWIHSNVLTLVLLTEEDASLRQAFMEKCLRSLDCFIDTYGEDGGCDEGPAYWDAAAASLFDCLEQIEEATAGQVSVFENTKIKNMGSYIAKVHIEGNQFVNFADGSPHLEVATDLIYRYGQRIQDPHLLALGKARETAVHPVGWMMYRYLKSFWHDTSTPPDGDPAYTHTWLPNIQVMTARTQDNHLFLAAKGGHNDESHNHNDIGQFIIYAYGKPVIIDIGVETYTAKTFSDQRYEIWTMQSAYHNLPTINGYEQLAGHQYAATDVQQLTTATCTQLKLNLKEAYLKQAGIVKWHRCCELIEQEPLSLVRVTDDFALTHSVSDLFWTLMTPCLVEIIDDSHIRFILDDGIGVILTHSKDLNPSIEKIILEDEKLKSSWGNCLYRIILKPEVPICKSMCIMEWHLEN